MQSMRGGNPSTTEVNRMDEAIHSNTGRIARVAIGGALVGLGVGRGGVLGGMVSLVGLEPLLAGVFNFSLVSMITGMFQQTSYSDPSTYRHETGSSVGDSVPSSY